MSKIKQSGSLSVDPSKMDSRDLAEGYYMLISAACLLRQSFGIVAMTNSLLKSPLSESDLKSFANQFDVVHKTLNSVSAGLKDYLDKRISDERVHSS